MLPISRLTAHDVCQARRADIASYLRAKGYGLRCEGKQFRVLDHGGLIIDGFKWFCFSTGRGGNSLDYATKVEGLSFRDAVSALLPFARADHAIGPSDIGPACKHDCGRDPLASPAEFTLPPPNAANTRVIHYLTRRRCLPVELVEKVVAGGLVYEDQRGNCVFPCRDRSGQPRAALLRGTDPKRRFLRMVAGSDSGFGWHLPPLRSPVDHVVAVTESPIDSLSLLVLRPALECFHHLSVNGVRRQTAPTFLDEHPDVRTAILGLDVDETGLQATTELSADLRNRGYTVAVLQPPDGAKDWNEALAARHRSGLGQPVALGGHPGEH
ncbi:MAG: DUF3991 and TOPRIM domain-containing protein [Bacillota bacterium]|nr:DUF3991 and TOPRIM domain-containing protein [Bacillota bacterium]